MLVLNSNKGTYTSSKERFYFTQQLEQQKTIEDEQDGHNELFSTDKFKNLFGFTQDDHAVGWT